MERYLSIDSISLALDGMQNLPSASELQDMMGKAEKMMFIHQGEVTNQLKTTAWYLHSVASTRSSLKLHDPTRIKRANQISAHIFDLVLEYGVDDEVDRLSYVFAGQIGYLKGGLSPNATALYKKANIQSGFNLTDQINTTALKLGIHLLALDRSMLFKIIPKLRIEAEEIGIKASKSSLTTVVQVIDAIWYMLIYISYGNEEHFLRAREILTLITRKKDSIADLNTRWVASHLMDINEYFRETALWGIMPPDIPSTAIRAMTLGNPPILSLWPPQIQLLDDDINESPLLLKTKRVFLSVPTSSGKTLMSQLFIVTHLAQNGGGVCVVAPSNSLCREIRKSLMSRLRFMNYNVADSIPEYTDDEELTNTDIEVMTPERLNFLIRTDTKLFLERFSLIVVDEAHLVGETSRGWGLEASLSLINKLTESSHHRIILMSSSLGKEGHIHQWLSSTGKKKSFHSEWRGPRRLYAMFSADIDISKPYVTIPPKTKKSHELHVFQLKGVVRLRIAETDKIHTVSLTRSVGQVAIQTDTHKRDISSTPQYKSAVPFILDLGESGPVLIIETSKNNALLMAKALAEGIKETNNSSNNIADFVTLRLGEEHPLTKVLRKGVAYHHAALPTDVQDAIETSIKDGELKYIVATTTLAEGINLPVRTVVISNTGSYKSGGEFKEFIKGPTLVNAIGRAGRAGKESEGWIILLGQFDAGRLDQLINTKEEDLIIQSNLSSDDFLSSLETAEEEIAKEEDAILRLQYSKAGSFVSQIWAALATIELINGVSREEDLLFFLQSTLGWIQLEDDVKTRWFTLATSTFSTYSKTAPDVRQRWAKAGTTIPTADKMETLARDIFNILIIKYMEEDSIPSLETAFSIIFNEVNSERILSLPEHNRVFFKPHRTATNDKIIQIDTVAILRDWINGKELSYLVSTYLAEIDDIEYAYESLGTFLTSTYENYLPWILSVIIGWINNYEKELLDGMNLIDPNLPHFIKYGVNSRIAVKLMMKGLRSRRFANALNKGFLAASDEGYDLDSWMKSLSIDKLIDIYSASKSEVEDYKSFINPEDSTFLSDLIEKDFSSFYLFGTYEFSVGPVVFEKKRTDQGNMSLYIKQNEMLDIELPIEHHKNIEMLIETGLPFESEITEVDDFGITFAVWIIDYNQ